MRYVKFDKTNSKKSFVDVMLGKMLSDVEQKLSDMEEVSIKEGNQNWKKSKLAIILLNMKRIIQKILDLRKEKRNFPEKEKSLSLKIKQLMLQLKITSKLANDEIQIQKERDDLLLKQKQKVLTPFEIRLIEQMQQRAM